MTREEITEVNKILDYTKKVNIVAYKALKKALEQEPCEDCISRDAVQNYVESHIQEINTGYGDLNNHTNRILRMIVDGIRNLPSIQPKPKTDVLDKIRALPSVTPTRKKGKWERGYSFPDGEYVKCTVCGEIIKCIYPMHFCPNCGAEMESEE